MKFLFIHVSRIGDQEFTLHWVQGNHQKLKELHQKFGNSVQSVYRTDENIEGTKTEFLSQAQTPDLWWKPDGVEIISNLISKS